MTTTDTAARDLQRKQERLEERLEDLANRVKCVERHTVELDALRQEIGNLKLEVEEFREAD